MLPSTAAGISPGPAKPSNPSSLHCLALQLTSLLDVNSNVEEAVVTLQDLQNRVRTNMPSQL